MPQFHLPLIGFSLGSGSSPKISMRSLLSIALAATLAIVLNGTSMAQEAEEQSVRERIAELSAGSEEDQAEAAKLKKEMRARYARDSKKKRDLAEYYGQALRDCAKLYENSDFEGAFALASKVVKRLEADRSSFKGPRQQVNYERMRARFYERYLYDAEKAEASYENAASLSSDNRMIGRRLAEIKERKRYAAEKLRQGEREAFAREVALEDLGQLLDSGEIGQARYIELLEGLEAASGGK